jgi:hypothetical protein
MFINAIRDTQISNGSNKERLVSMNTYLYVKTHSKTGYKYLGKTKSKDPHLYAGSGVDWKAHLEAHGEKYSTKIIKICKSNKEVNYWGRYYSKLWNVVEDNNWANRIPETGGGSCSSVTAKKISKLLKGRKKPPRTLEHIEKLAASVRGRPNPKTALGLKKYYASNPDRSDIIKKQAQSVSKWRRANPKKVKESSLKAWNKKYAKKYNDYKKVIEFIKSNNYNNFQIHNITKFDWITVSKLRKKTHRIYKVFPELVY